jgi:hypothetical protein
MKISELEDGDKVVTKDFLRAEIAELKAEILGRLLDMQSRMRQLIFGTYALIVIGVFVNHFWK